MTTKSHKTLTGTQLHEPKGADSADANTVYLADGSGSGVWSTIGDTTGDLKPTIKTVADTGYILLNDGTIGSASSGASTRANADCEDLYTLLWTNVSDTYAPVTGGRGVSAAADWAANKPIGVLKILGRAIGAAGAGSGLTSRSLGSTAGSETHQLTAAELASHSHTYVVHSGSYSVQEGGSFSIPISSWTTGNTGSSGSGDAHTSMQPTVFINWMIKL